MDSQGVVYIVTRSAPHLAECVFSAQSLQRCSPQVPATLFTDLPLDAESAAAFSRVVKIEADEHPLKLKVRLLAESPYRRTLFLDADTEVMRDLTPIFSALDDHDFAICREPHVDMSVVDPESPQNFSPGDFFKGYANEHLVNTGVFLFSDSDPARRLIRDWYEAIRGQDESDMRPGRNCDQVSFQGVLWRFIDRHPLRLKILDNCVWNARSFLYSHFQRDGLLDGITISHGRPTLSVQRSAEVELGARAPGSPAEAVPVAPGRALPVILEYCGGAATDRLYQALSIWNPDWSICVLDNASPGNLSRVATHRNPENSFVGGGVKDCIALARRSGAEHLIFIANDVQPCGAVDFGRLVEILESDPAIVQVGAAITSDSDRARNHPWMIHQPVSEPRLVPHCDLLLCALRLDFVDSFGGFPDSRSGYGFDFELAHQARLQGKKILVVDRFVLRHTGDADKGQAAFEPGFDKQAELRAVYDERYGSWEKIDPTRFGS